jgi:hypothetical protein
LSTRDENGYREYPIQGAALVNSATALPQVPAVYVAALESNPTRHDNLSPLRFTRPRTNTNLQETVDNDGVHEYTMGIGGSHQARADEWIHYSNLDVTVRKNDDKEGEGGEGGGGGGGGGGGQQGEEGNGNNIRCRLVSPNNNCVRQPALNRSKPITRANESDIASPKATTKTNDNAPLTRKATQSNSNLPPHDLDSTVRVYASYKKPLFIIFGLPSEILNRFEELKSDVSIPSQPAPKGSSQASSSQDGCSGNLDENAPHQKSQTTRRILCQHRKPKSGDLVHYALSVRNLTASQIAENISVYYAITNSEIHHRVSILKCCEDVQDSSPKMYRHKSDCTQTLYEPEHKFRIAIDVINKNPTKQFYWSEQARIKLCRLKLKNVPLESQSTTLAQMFHRDAPTASATHQAWSRLVAEYEKSRGGLSTELRTLL